MQNILGIDIGGSHITIAQVQPEKREIIASTYIREHVDSFECREVIFSKWVSAIERGAKGLTKEGLLIGIAMPGPFDYEKGISLIRQGKYIDIYRINIKEELAKRLSISEDQFHFVNDAAAFLKGEVLGGCAKGYKRVFGVTLGTGFGTTFYDGNKATDEALWNFQLKDSICEDYLATRWFINRYTALTGEQISGTKDLLEKPKEIQSRMFDEYADSLAEFVIKYVRFYDPEVLVIGGNIAKTYPYFEEKFNKNLVKNNISMPVKISAIFEDAAILGAASYVLKKMQRINKHI
ncbi:ROK family protein [Chryseobacterium geocarposphaerae]|uniref:Glucokinase n=1 Tax=Chryseobacterium geocarposphaerae TaxID=1416776 RepID=A0A2M9C974_9FLAO|nr:ROK family protein [Chryseobacterium geocarposphaerae]PJJ67401.1 glucokinase [Chryseobacterium geocarposphaerae]